MLHRLLISLLTFLAAYLLVRYGHGPAQRWLARQEQAYDRALRRQLLLDIEPRVAVWLTVAGVVLAGLLGYAIADSLLVAALCAAAAMAAPTLLVRHLATKRREKLESQLVDGLTTLASGTRAGLNLVQSMELLVRHHHPPISQEFAQLLREYQMGLDLNQAMRNASNRIGSPLYRLTFTAIEMHRVRGGDTAQSMDRIAESIREIHRLEGKLDALTSQGRMQAWMMAAMPVVFLALFYLIMPTEVTLLFVEPIGRLMLLGVVVLIVIAFVWIRRIMAVEI